jgi:ammonia channel protein AmtB
MPPVLCRSPRAPQLCAGAIRSKNAMNILLQTVLDAACSALMWYLVGFGFAFGQGANPNKFIGEPRCSALTYPYTDSTPTPGYLNADHVLFLGEPLRSEAQRQRA